MTSTSSFPPPIFLIIQHAPMCPATMVSSFIKSKIPSAVVEVMDISTRWSSFLSTSPPNSDPLTLPPTLFTSLPNLSNYHSIISLGGPQDAYNITKYPYILHERVVISHCISLGIPFLGICLGAQVMADVIGGKTYKMERMEVGTPILFPTDTGKEDEFIGDLIYVCKSATECELFPYLEHHFDSFTLPSQGSKYHDIKGNDHDIILMACSKNYKGEDIPQIIKCGSAYGVQFHPEAVREDYANWINREKEYYPSAVGIQKTVEQLLSEYDEKGKLLQNSQNKFFDSWWKQVEQLSEKRISMSKEEKKDLEGKSNAK